jgi:hypothetical protein
MVAPEFTKWDTEGLLSRRGHVQHPAGRSAAVDGRVPVARCRGATDVTGFLVASLGGFAIALTVTGVLALVSAVMYALVLRRGLPV